MLSLIYILNKMLKFILLVSSSVLLTACIVVESPVPVVVNKEITTTIDNPSIPALNSLRTLQIRTHDNRCVELSPFNQKELLASRCQSTFHQKFNYNQDKSITVQGKCLDVSGANKNDGAQVIAYQCNNQANQKWFFDGYRIRSQDSGKCLDIYNGKMKMYTCSNNRGQQFTIIPSP